MNGKMNIHQVIVLPAEPEPDALYFVQPVDGNSALFITDDAGVVYTVSNPTAIQILVDAAIDNLELTKADIGLDQVENLAPADLPVSDATTAALATKADGAATTAALATKAPHVVSLTQAAYDALTPDPQTLYFINDA